MKYFKWILSIGAGFSPFFYENNFNGFSQNLTFFSQIKQISQIILNDHLSNQQNQRRIK